ncbi:hypothetical protein GHK92_12020 [Nocardioides sp. dk4132]|uniref:hypothetical protein n=1 Tax=unclassified Nocardioides TaxID=2615069 RepID=UPI0012970498|nr:MULTISPECIES: hypothetical protein [unclassified Nocardioides]MQW76606.1 hypothetical protein [Nocardioides sp. dk4132]QGA07022.1 hypothetical protein GFH29_06200 [Nocardioides sp. dk884]
MRRLLPPALLVSAVLLAGCGDDPAPDADPLASVSTGSSTPGGTAMAPAWPPPGCRELSVAASSFAEDARGEESPEAAALDAVEEGVRAIRGSEPGGADKRTWYVVAADGTGIAAVEVLRDAVGTGWLAASVERCADPAPY